MSGDTKRTVTIWELCRVCALQMTGGPRCYRHNPTPEARDGQENAKVAPGG